MLERAITTDSVKHFSQLSTAFFRHKNRVADDHRMAAAGAAACQQIADFEVRKARWIIRITRIDR